MTVRMVGVDYEKAAKLTATATRAMCGCCLSLEMESQPGADALTRGRGNMPAFITQLHSSVCFSS